MLFHTYQVLRKSESETALAVGAGGGCLDILLSPILSPLSPSLLEMAQYRLKYCLKEPLNPKQPTNQPNLRSNFSPFPQYFQYAYLTKGVKLRSFVKFGCLIRIFLNSANLICRNTDIWKCFRGSL